MLKRSEEVGQCFELLSTKRRSAKNPEGKMYFTAWSELELQGWINVLALIIESDEAAEVDASQVGSILSRPPSTRLHSNSSAVDRQQSTNLADRLNSKSLGSKDLSRSRLNTSNISDTTYDDAGGYNGCCFAIDNCMSSFYANTCCCFRSIGCKFTVRMC